MVEWTRRWSVPASLLLMGEYAITRDGGQGVAIATSPRATGWITARKQGGAPEEAAPEGAAPAVGGTFFGGSLEFRAIGGEGLNLTWPQDELPLIDAVIAIIADELSPGSRIDAATAGRSFQAAVNTTSFFDPRTGEKHGLGSSAAAALLASVALLAAAGLEGPSSPAPGQRAIRTAIAAHRRIQDGRGSGYDVACSAMGGMVRFTGGVTPLCTRVSPPEGLQVFTIKAGPPVRSSAAVARFDGSCSPDSAAGQLFLEENNRLVQEFCNSRTGDRHLDVLEQARKLSEELGDRIGVSAALPLTPAHPRGDGWVAKSSGAGNERAVIVAGPRHRRPLPSGSREAPIEDEGLREEASPLHGRARGKLLLFGEHAAVYGYPALGMSLNEQMSVTLIPGGEWRVAGAGAGGGAGAEHRGLAQFFSRLQEELRLPPGELIIQSELPLGSGFGSSAALTVACARMAGLRDTHAVWLQAHRLEEVFHGSPSGIDTGLSTLEGSWLFQSNQGSENGALPLATACPLPELHLVVGSVPRMEDTRTLVARVAEQQRVAPAKTTAILRRLGQLSRSAAGQSATGAPEDASEPGTLTTDSAQIAGYAREAHQLLSTLGLVTPEVARLIAIGEETGAMGGKMSGAGGGGAFFLVCPTAESAHRVHQALQQHLPAGGSLMVTTTAG